MSRRANPDSKSRATEKPVKMPPKVAAWTDDYSDIMGAMLRKKLGLAA